jgi:hypothetical protein
MRNTMRLLVLVAATLQGGWMLIDGIHALRSGAYFGTRLGPWAAVVSQAGIDPRSTAMKVAFVAFGLAWLAVVVFMVARLRQALIVAIAAGSLTLWFLPIGTLLSAMVIVSAWQLRRAG